MDQELENLELIENTGDLESMTSSQLRLQLALHKRLKPTLKIPLSGTKSQRLNRLQTILKENQ